MSDVRTGSTLPLLVHADTPFEKSDVFCTKKCGRPHLNNPLVRKMSALDKAPPPPDCGRLLWTALNVYYVWIRKPFPITFPASAKHAI